MSCTRRTTLARLATPGLATLMGLHARAVEPDATQRRPWPTDQPTPALALQAWNGSPWNLAEQRGQLLVLNFWASWCEPCRSELPTLERLARRHAADRLQVVCINYRETDGAIKSFLNTQPLALPVLRDRDGATSKAWGARIFPTTVVVDRQGRAAFSVIGELDWDGAQVRAWLAPLL
jgi:thiol-disulfide isomerase/thioredoxin